MYILDVELIDRFLNSEIQRQTKVTNFSYSRARRHLPYFCHQLVMQALLRSGFKQ